MAKVPLVTRGVIQKFKDDPEVQRFLMSLEGTTTDVSLKANKVIGGEEDNIVTLTSDGDIQDSGQSVTSINSSSFFFARIY